MKIGFDEHVSPRLIDALGIIQKPGAATFVDFRKSYGELKGDAGLVRLFAADGGHTMLSGDTNMPNVLPTVVAIQEAGLRAVFLPPAWCKAKRHPQTAFLIRWWPDILKLAAESEAGSGFVISYHWTSFQARPIQWRRQLGGPKHEE